MEECIYEDVLEPLPESTPDQECMGSCYQDDSCVECNCDGECGCDSH